MSSLTRTDVQENLDESFEIRARDLRNKLVLFRFRKLSQEIKLERIPMPNIEPRLRQIMTPLYSMSTEQGKREILQFLERKQQELIDNRTNSLEGEVLQSLLQVLESDSQPTMKEICIQYNDKFSGKYQIKPKKVGQILDQIFHLHKKKTAEGIVMEQSEQNALTIELLKKKYGLQKPEMNMMHIVQQQKRMADEIFDTPPVIEIST